MKYIQTDTWTHSIGMRRLGNWLMVALEIADEKRLPVRRKEAKA
jgi:hypothetical protein